MWIVFKVTNTLGQTLTIKASGDSMGVAAIFHGAIDSSVISLGKIGFHSWDAEASLSVGSLNVRIADDGTDPSYAADLTYNVRENM